MAEFKRIGIVGAGNMGTMMSYAFLEMGLEVSIWDVSSSNVDQALEGSKEVKAGRGGKIIGYHDINKFTQSLDDGDERRLFLFSITHGKPADEVLKKMGGNLKKGDIVLDGGNESWLETERRQKELEERGVNWIGMGVSGGYQSARHGPSLSPGGDKTAIETVLPLLEKFAAKDRKSGKPCVAYIGPGGSGHFVKMVHNGIEGGMLSTIAEAWSILHKSLGMEYDEIGEIFTKWNEDGELQNTFLVEIGAQICKTKKTAKGDGHGEGEGKSGYVLDDVLDKVVQDDDNTEGTPYWTVMEAAKWHVSSPTIATGHIMRVASGNRAQRLKVVDQLRLPQPQKARLSDSEKSAFVETLRKAVFASFLCAFCQGLELIARTSHDNKWDISLSTCIRIWRAGCIIQEEYIADMLQPVFESASKENISIMNIKLIDEVATALRENFSPLKEIVLRATEWDNYIPSISASLEYLKYEGGKMLPTQFMEAQMDFFGAHSYDRPGVEGEDPGKVKKGPHHYEWRPA